LLTIEAVERQVGILTVGSQILLKYAAMLLLTIRSYQQRFGAVNDPDLILTAKTGQWCTVVAKNVTNC
jgi:hypothetical protein